MVAAGGRRAQRELSLDPFEQRQADHGFELLDLHRDRWLGQVQFLGGAHEASNWRRVRARRKDMSSGGGF